MISTVIIAILALVAVALLAWGAFGAEPDSRSDLPSRRARAGVGVVVGVLGVVVWFLASFTIVSAAEVGVPVTFGRVGAPLPAGPHLVAPWTSVETYPVRPFAVPDVTITSRTAQAGQVKTTVGARWHVRKDGAAELYLQVRTGDENTISQTVVDKALGQAVGNVFAGKDNLTATTDRAGVEAGIFAELQRLVAPYGIAVDNVFVRAVEPDAKTADALARVAAQQRATEIARESEQTNVAQAQANLAAAQGVQKAAAALPTNLTAEQVTLLCAQAWERMATKAIEAGVSLYTSPCGTAATPVVGGGR